jgi:hypothetical protein
VIYLDSSVALAQLLFESRSPPTSFWQQPLVSSRLLEYEVWNRAHAYGLASTRADDVRAILALVDMIEMTRSVLAKVLGPLPISLPTLDALHLATMDFLRGRSASIELASYDDRLLAAAAALGFRAAGL